MVDVQDCDLVVVLTQDEEEGVHELYELGEVVPPEDTDDLRGRGHQRCSGIPALVCLLTSPNPVLTWRGPSAPPAPEVLQQLGVLITLRVA